MNILVTGLCTLHWGRMEFGNVGNYYIVEPFFKQLHRVFPDAQIKTTFQMSETFAREEQIQILNINLYYSWDKDFDNLKAVQLETSYVQEFIKTGKWYHLSPYIKEVLQSDLIIDLSGDMWGDNADIAGENRFEVDLLKIQIAQMLHKKTAMLIGSPGPFNKCSERILKLAKTVYANFDYVTNREPFSTKRLLSQGFDLSKTKNSFCTAFLSKSISDPNLIFKLQDFKKDQPLVGISICGFNFPTGTYDFWPRPDADFDILCELVEYIISTHHSKIMLLSHNNAFSKDPIFQLKNGRDYFILEKLYNRLITRKKVNPAEILLWDFPIFAPQVKFLIGETDIYISGRAHAAVAAFSQNVPCLILDYLNGPTPQKLKGFAADVGMEKYVTSISNIEKTKILFDELFYNRDKTKAYLLKENLKIKNDINRSFDFLKDIVKE